MSTLSFTLSEDAAALFNRLAPSGERVLFESLDPGTHRQLHTFAMLDAALRLVCRGRSVELTACVPEAEALVEKVGVALRGQRADDPRGGRDGQFGGVHRGGGAFRVEAAGTSPGEFPYLDAIPLPPCVGESHAGEGISAEGRGTNPPASMRPSANVTLTLADLPPVAEERARLLQPSTLDVLRAALEAAGEGAMLFGGFAFDLLETFESLPAVSDADVPFPDYVFYLARTTLAIDHATASATLRRHLPGPHGRPADLADLSNLLTRVSRETSPRTPDAAASDPVIHPTADVTAADFARAVERCQEHIAAGDVYQVVPSRGFSLPCPDAWASYLRLRDANPSPYLFYLDTPFGEVFGASPESSVRFNADDRTIAIRPIAGTQPRALKPGGGYDLDEDTRREVILRTDPKETAEHLMLVDLARNDVARVAVAGTRHVASLLSVEKYSRVMHLVSEVRGTLAPGLDALDAYRACANMGTLSGAPKIRATALLREVEGRRRGLYGGAVGYLTASGDFDSCIAIRCAHVVDGVARVRAGAGVVRDSVPALEAAETFHKASAVLSAIAATQGARLGEEA